MQLKFKSKQKKLTLLLFNHRLKRIYSFENISENILFDILGALKDLNSSYEQVHAILPLLCDIRKHGDKLILQRKFYHLLFFPDSEQKLANKIVRLHEVENFIKSLSRHRAEGQNRDFDSALRKVS